MSYPANHIPEARDGVEGLLEQIATSVGAITDDASSVEDKLAAIAVALAAAEAAAAAPAVTLTSLGLVDTSLSTKWPVSAGDGTISLLTSNESLAELVAAFDATQRLAWQQALFTAFVTDVTSENYTILATDIGKIIRFNRPTDITVTCPKAFAEGFNCCWLQKGNGQVNFTAQAGGSAAVVNVDSHYWSKGPYAVGSLIVESNSDNNSAIWYLAGATAIST